MFIYIIYIHVSLDIYIYCFSTKHTYKHTLKISSVEAYPGPRRHLRWRVLQQ